MSMPKFKIGDKICGPAGGKYEVLDFDSMVYKLLGLNTKREYLRLIDDIDNVYTSMVKIPPNTGDNWFNKKIFPDEPKVVEKWVTCCLCNKRRYCHQIHDKSDWYCRICGETPNNQRNKRGDLM